MKNFNKNICLCIFLTSVLSKCAPKALYMESGYIKKNSVVDNARDSNDDDKPRFISSNYDKCHDNVKLDNEYENDLEPDTPIFAWEQNDGKIEFNEEEIRQAQSEVVKKYIKEPRDDENKEHMLSYDKEENDFDEEYKEELPFEKSETNMTAPYKNKVVKAPIQYKVYERSYYADKDSLPILLKRKIFITDFIKNDDNSLRGGTKGSGREGERYIFTEHCVYDDKGNIYEKEISVELKPAEIKKYENHRKYISEKRYICDKMSLKLIMPNLEKEVNDSGKKKNACSVVKPNNIKIENKPSIGMDNKPNIEIVAPKKVDNVTNCRTLSTKDILILLVGLQFGFIFAAFYFGNLK